jgi:hypothetical protein
LEALSDVERKNIDSGSHDKLKVLSDLQNLTVRAKEECIRKQWKYTRSNGKTVVLRDVFDSVLQWVEMFKKIGDVVAGCVPALVAPPWAGVKFLLDVRDTLQVLITVQFIFDLLLLDHTQGL